jgi:hypothetical protein
MKTVEKHNFLCYNGKAKPLLKETLYVEYETI